MIPSEFVQIRHRLGGYLKRVGFYHDVDGWALMDDPREGGFMTPADADQFFERRDAAIAFDELTIVPAIGCGCCGKFAPYGGHPMNADFKRFGRHWRCSKHVNRVPCLIEGCGRTFAHARRGGARAAEGHETGLAGRSV